MLTFSHTILKLLNEYKSILKKQLPQQQAWTAKVQALGLKRKILKYDDEITLYRKALAVVDDLELRIKNETDIPAWHSGLEKFGQFLKETLAEYQIENNKVVHTSQQASRAIVEAFQLMQTPNATFNSIIERKLDQCGQTIARYGSQAQQDMFSNALKEYQCNDVNFFLRLSTNFECYLEEFTNFFNNEYNPELEADFN